MCKPEWLPHISVFESFFHQDDLMLVTSYLQKSTQVIVLNILRSLTSTCHNSNFLMLLILFSSGNIYLAGALLSSVQFSQSVMSDSVMPWIAAHQASLSITNSQSLLKLMSIQSAMPSSHLILCGPLLPLPPICPSIRVFSNKSTLLMRWPKYWSFSFSISPSNEHPGLISFGMDWLYLLAVQGTLKSLLQYHRSKASIFRCSAFFTVQLSHP